MGGEESIVDVVNIVLTIVFFITTVLVGEV
jgi:uncharacterized membrane protein